MSVIGQILSLAELIPVRRAGREPGAVRPCIVDAARDGGQGFDVALKASDAQFRGPTPLAIREGELNATGFFGGGCGISPDNKYFVDVLCSFV